MRASRVVLQKAPCYATWVKCREGGIRGDTLATFNSALGRSRQLQPLWKVVRAAAPRGCCISCKSLLGVCCVRTISGGRS